jgi:hypothetical protein
MKYLTEFDETKTISKVHIVDEMLVPRDVFELQHTAIELHASFGCRKYLFDVTNAKINSGTLPAIQAAQPLKEKAKILRSFKAAILYKNLSDHERFVETVALNRGFSIKVFDKFDKAFTWLRDQ